MFTEPSRPERHHVSCKGRLSPAARRLFVQKRGRQDAGQRRAEDRGERRVDPVLVPHQGHEKPRASNGPRDDGTEYGETKQAIVSRLGSLLRDRPLGNQVA